MKASVYHVQLNVPDAAVSLPFYRSLLDYLEFRVVHEDRCVAGFSDGRTALWLIETEPGHRDSGFHRKRTGINHVAFRVPRREDVDQFTAEFLKPRGIAPLYDTPRECPENAPGYYAVFFEDPDRLKLEVASVPAVGG